MNRAVKGSFIFASPDLKRNPSASGIVRPGLYMISQLGHPSLTTSKSNMRECIGMLKIVMSQKIGAVRSSPRSFLQSAPIPHRLRSLAARSSPRATDVNSVRTRCQKLEICGIEGCPSAGHGKIFAAGGLPPRQPRPREVRNSLMHLFHLAWTSQIQPN